MQAMNALERTRTISLTLNTQKIGIVVRDPTSEWDMRLMTGIKNAALGAVNGLEPLIHERWLMDFSQVPACEVPEEILAPMRSARAVANEMLATVELECFADIVKAPGCSTTDHEPLIRLIIVVLITLITMVMLMIMIVVILTLTRIHLSLLIMLLFIVWIRIQC